MHVRTISRLAVVSLVAAGVTLASSLGALGHAAAQDAPDAQDVARARDAFRRGVARYQAADYASALESFQEAYRIAPNPAVRVNMANCYERLERPNEAIFNYEQFLAEAGPTVPAARRTEVEAALAGLRARFAEVTITMSPDDRATMSIDGAPDSPPPPQPLRLAPGRHVLEITRPGEPTQRRDLDLTAGTATSIDLTRLAPPPGRTPPPPEAGPAPTITGQPVVAPAPPPTVEPAQGLAPDADSYREPPRGGGLRITAPVAIVGSATLALVVGATISGVLAMGANSDFDADVAEVQDPATPPDARTAARARGLDDADRASTLALVTDVLLVGAVVGAGVTTVLLVMQPSSSTERTSHSRPRTVAAPTVDRNGVGVVVTGTF